MQIHGKGEQRKGGEGGKEKGERERGGGRRIDKGKRGVGARLGQTPSIENP